CRGGRSESALPVTAGFCASRGRRCPIRRKTPRDEGEGQEAERLGKEREERGAEADVVGGCREANRRRDLEGEQCAEYGVDQARAPGGGRVRFGLHDGVVGG